MNKEQAKELPVFPGTKFEQVVESLIIAEQEGNNVFYVFNGKKLYADGISYDGASQELFGMSYGDFLKEFAKERHKNQIELEKEKAQKVDAYVGNLDNAILYLEKAKKEGRNIYLSFNGVKLYSIDISEDKAYLAVTKLNKADYEAAVEKEMEAFRKNSGRNLE